MSSPRKILIVDDDPEIRMLLSRALDKAGFRVRTLSDGGKLSELLAREPYDCLILDLMLPGEDGLSICRRLRFEKNFVPIIMLTAKGDDIDRIIGLEMGADDYLPKPFNPRELIARIEALLRRSAITAAAGAAERIEDLAFGPFLLDFSSRRLTRGGAEVALTSGEYEMLAALAQHPRKPLGRERLLALTKGRDSEALDRSVDIQIMRLRKIIEPDMSEPRYIRTVRGFGYVFLPDAGPQT